MKIPLSGIADEGKPCGCGMNACCGECLRKERRRHLAVLWLATVLVVLAVMAIVAHRRNTTVEPMTNVALMMTVMASREAYAVLHQWSPLLATPTVTVLQIADVVVVPNQRHGLLANQLGKCKWTHFRWRPYKQ
jgi:hypothetical protein